MWLVDSERYFALPGARWLTYQNTARQYVDALSAQVGGGGGADAAVQERTLPDAE